MKEAAAVADGMDTMDVKVKLREFWVQWYNPGTMWYTRITWSQHCQNYSKLKVADFLYVIISYNMLTSI